jgi:nicotinate-nucleotide adenylyltransferase
VASPEHRLSMLKLALAGEPRYRIDIRELAPGASGYTVDTLKSLRAETGSTDALYLLLGADQYAALATWRRPDEVKKLARIAVFARPGFKVAGKDAETVPMKPLAISASDIRARVAGGASLAGLVPEPVRKYIMDHKLYR